VWKEGRSSGAWKKVNKKEGVRGREEGVRC
jgi:hypothetical protein